MNEAREKYALAEEHYHAALRISDEMRNKGVVDEMKYTSHRAWILDAMANLAIADQKPYKVMMIRYATILANSIVILLRSDTYT